MPGFRHAELVVSGLGVVTGFGAGRDALKKGLRDSQSLFKPMTRPGRVAAGEAVIGIEMPDPPLTLSRAWNMSLPARAAHAAIAEAWDEAALAGVDPARVGLIVGGSNVQQRSIALAHQSFLADGFVLPSHALTFMDTDLCGLCTEAFGIRGQAYTIGGASASGQLAVIHAARAVAAGEVDACIALGALMDLSALECHAFRALGAMGTDCYADRPAEACRPFDRRTDGFIYGEACAALVIERASASRARGATPYAGVLGAGVRMDGNRQPNSSVAGEVAAIQAALHAAGLAASDIDYVNPHGSGSPSGDLNEVAALRQAGLGHVWINATKSIVGHGLTAAGAVEISATLLQMRAGFLHPSRNLCEPIDDGLHWVCERVIEHRPRIALTLSHGFGGINTALCLQHLDS
jgi:malonyl-ACP decarboxylase